MNNNYNSCYNLYDMVQLYYMTGLKLFYILYIGLILISIIASYSDTDGHCEPYDYRCQESESMWGHNAENWQYPR